MGEKGELAFLPAVVEVLEADGGAGEAGPDQEEQGAVRAIAVGGGCDRGAEVCEDEGELGSQCFHDGHYH